MPVEDSPPRAGCLALDEQHAPDGQDRSPIVVTVHHHLVTGGEILGRPPGPWCAAAFAERTLPTAPGNPYLLWGLPPPPGTTPRTKPPDAIC